MPTEQKKKDLLKNLSSEDFNVDKVFNMKAESSKELLDKNSGTEVEKKDGCELITEKFQIRRDDIKEELSTIRKKMRDFKEFVEVSVLCHGLRQRLLEEKFNIQKLIAGNEQKTSSKKESEYIKLKTGKADNQIYLKNKIDFDISLNAKTGKLKQINDILVAQKDYLEGTIKGIDNILWSLKHIIEMQKIINGM